jgi:hypothetical protein
MNALSASELADLAGVTEAEVGRLVDLGVLVARDGVGPFLATDVPKVRLATACEQAGLPLAGSPPRSGRAGCRSRSWRPPPTGSGRCARRGPTGR